jgi:alkaline phosphatase D
VWAGDTCGQGWGIDEARGGFVTYSTMRKSNPDFFLHSGDNIYADYALEKEIKVANGEVWRNLVTEEKAKVAETLGEFRGNYKYNLRDKNLLAFNSEIPMLAQWDDHEVNNNWWPAEALFRDEHKKKGYKVANTMLLQAHGARAFHEYMPVRSFSSEPGRIYRKVSYGPLLDVFLIDMRSYRGSNETTGMDEVYGPASHYLGPLQVAWLKRELAASRAVWKIIAADMPLALVRVYDPNLRGLEASAQGDHGRPRGRELEFADILSFAKRQSVRNMVWLTADVHYTAAHFFDPNKAAFQDFDPFWEFVSGPILAGTGVPGAVDNTFGPQRVFVKGSNSSLGSNLSPAYGMQFFGLVQISSDGVMTVSLKDVGDNLLWSTKVEPV